MTLLDGFKIIQSQQGKIGHCDLSKQHFNYDVPYL